MIFQQKKNDLRKEGRGMKKYRMFLMLFFILLILSACGDNTHHQDENNEIDNKQDDNNHAFKVVIDPGHGGKDNGATSVSGQYEKDFNLSLAKKVEKLLKEESGIEVYMTRTDDSFISQESRYRPKYANELNAHLFISIHGNTFTDSNVSGTETYYYHNHSRKLAQILQKHVVEATGFKDRGVRKEDLFVVKDTKMPAALIEVGYLTSPHDESNMWKDEFQSRVAASIVEGIKEYKESL